MSQKSTAYEGSKPGPYQSQRHGSVDHLKPFKKPLDAAITLLHVGPERGQGAIRLSPHCYNTRAEMTRALELLGG